MTLGYVFWHWPRRGTSSRVYQTRLAAFHASLGAHPPEGMLETLSFREPRRPWTHAGGTTYEDWYLIKDYASLGALNEGAVSGAVRSPHDSVAEEALGGAGGIYLLRGGRLELSRARFVTWATKPPRTTYQAFIGRLSELADDEGDVWQRQMVLGPAPEFCVHSRVPVELPRSFAPVTIPLKLVWGRAA